MILLWLYPHQIYFLIIQTILKRALLFATLIFRISIWPEVFIQKLVCFLNTSTSFSAIGIISFIWLVTRNNKERRYKLCAFMLQATLAFYLILCTSENSSKQLKERFTPLLSFLLIYSGYAFDYFWKILGLQIVIVLELFVTLVTK